MNMISQIRYYIMNAVIRPSHRLADRPVVDPAELADDAFLATTLREGLGFFQTQLDICRDAGFEPRIVSRSRHFAAMMSLVAAGQGVAFVPSPVSRLALPGVSYRQVKSDRVSQVAVLHRSEASGPALARYLRLCAEAGREISPGEAERTHTLANPGFGTH